MVAGMPIKLNDRPIPFRSLAGGHRESLVLQWVSGEITFLLVIPKQPVVVSSTCPASRVDGGLQQRPKKNVLSWAT